MTSRDYQLGNTISRATEATRLWQTERGIIEIAEDTLAIPIKLGDQEKGYVFHGRGKLLIDTIVETEGGAIGKPVDEELNAPFLMLGNTEDLQQHLSPTNNEDHAKMGYKNRKEFVDRAEDLFNRFAKRGKTESHQHSSKNHGFIFAFENPTSRLDILVANGSNLVYKAEDVVFVSNKSNVVLKNPAEVVCSNSGRSVIIRKGKSVIIKN